MSTASYFLLLLTFLVAPLPPGLTTLIGKLSPLTKSQQGSEQSPLVSRAIKRDRIKLANDCLLLSQASTLGETTIN